MSATPSPSAVRPDAMERLRQEFPILSVRPHGRRLAYLDNAATTQKPREVLAEIGRAHV